MTLRPYQHRLVIAAIEYMLRSKEPFVIDAVTGSGKSHVIAAVAADIHARTGKRILCLAPSAELVRQNREKFTATGAKASTFSASAGGKETRHPVVFGSPLTVRNQVRRFKDDYALVIVDECHGITPTVQRIIAEMREGNPNLRVMGLTATPYRLGSGYIYVEEPDGHRHGEDKARDPYFGKCVERVEARELIDQGFLTQPVIGAILAEKYDTAGLTLNSRGQFDAADVDKAYHGQGRKTAAIVADVIEQARGRRGVMFFAATVQHAREVLASLPAELSALVTGETSQAKRANILAAFKAQEIKYIVNVSVLTTGFDAPHVDVIAILRKTESVGLLQQIIGRGLRIYPDKADCLILDYTTNLEEHCPDGDLFAPVIRAGKAPGTPGGVAAICPECGYENEFTIRPEVADAGYEISDDGYCLDLDGLPVETEFGPMPAHFGRRCLGQVRNVEKQKYERCGYRWTGKDCPKCHELNDIAARYCSACKCELVDPNKKLAASFRMRKADPTQVQTDLVLTYRETDGVSQKGNKTLRVDYSTPYRDFCIWYQPESTHPKAREEWQAYQKGVAGGMRTITYRKNKNDRFYRALAYNETHDMAPKLNEAPENETV